jgi:guanylate kinase
MRPLFLVLTGPSGSGKTTLARELYFSDPKTFEISISYTTRPKRESEEHGKHYYFVHDKEFRSLIDQGFFLEFELINGYFYGTPLPKFDQSKITLFALNFAGVKNLKRRFLARGCSEASFLERKNFILEEIATLKSEGKRWIDFFVENRELQSTINLVKMIISSIKLKMSYE